MRDSVLEDWADYLETVDERGLAGFVECGGVFVGSDERYSEKVLPLFDGSGSSTGLGHRILTVDPGHRHRRVRTSEAPRG
jgi:hypothetical protein